MNLANFNTTTVPWIDATETIIITRYTPGAVDRLARQHTQIYAGAASVQIGSGDTFIDAGGAVAQAEAIAIIHAATDGSLPDVQINDAVAVQRANGTPDDYTVTVVNPAAFPPAHLELSLKKGLHYAGPRS